jgi:hypothetical protein
MQCSMQLAHGHTHVYTVHAIPSDAVQQTAATVCVPQCSRACSWCWWLIDVGAASLHSPQAFLSDCSTCSPVVVHCLQGLWCVTFHASAMNWQGNGLCLECAARSGDDVATRRGPVPV